MPTGRRQLRFNPPPPYKTLQALDRRNRRLGARLVPVLWQQLGRQSGGAWRQRGHRPQHQAQPQPRLPHSRHHAPGSSP